MACVVAFGAYAGVRVDEFSVVESFYYVFGTVYWGWVGLVASAWD